jgi:HEAT repeat protein
LRRERAAKWRARTCLGCLLFAASTAGAGEDEHDWVVRLGHKDTTEETAERLVGLGPSAVRILVAALKEYQSKDPEVATVVALSLERLGPDAAAAADGLVEALSGTDKLTGAAVDALVHIGAGAVPRLRQALSDSRDVVRYSAAAALGEIGPPARSALPDLIKASGDRHRHVRQYCVVALRQIDVRAPGVVPALRERLADEDVGVRLSAIDALGQAGPAATEAIPGLRTFLKN